MNKLLIALLTLLSLAPPMFAQEQAEELYLWSGFVQPKEGKAIQEMKDPLTQEQVEKRIAEIQHNLKTLREIKIAEADINYLWRQVNLKCNMKPEVRKEQLISVALARSEIYAYSQSWDKSKQALTVLALTKTDSNPTKPALLAPISDDYETWLKLFGNDERITGRLIDIRKMSTGSLGDGPQIRPVLSQELEDYILNNFGSVDPALLAHIAKSLRNGNVDAVTQLGQRSIPSLALLILQDLTKTNEIFSSDPFLALLSVDSGSIFQIISDHFPNATLDWKFRSFQTYKERRSQILQWANKESQHRALGSIPHSDLVLAHFVKEQSLRKETLDFVGALSGNTMRREGSNLGQSLGEIFNECNLSEKIQITSFSVNFPLYIQKEVGLKALGSKDPQLRYFGVSSLNKTPQLFPLLLPFAKDEDSDIRAAVSHIFGDRSSFQHGYTREDFYSFLESEEAQEAFLALITDPNEKVRQFSIRHLISRNHNWNFPDVELYIAAIPYIDFNPREFFRIPFRTENDEIHFLNSVVKSDNLLLIKQFDDNLHKLNWKEKGSTYLSAFIARSQKATVPFPSGRDGDSEAKVLSYHRYLANRLSHSGYTSAAIKTYVDIGMPQALMDIHDQEKLSLGFSELPAPYALRCLAEIRKESRSILLVCQKRVLETKEVGDKELEAIALNEEVSGLARMLALEALFIRSSGLAESTALALLDETSLNIENDVNSIPAFYFQEPQRHHDFLFEVAWKKYNNTVLQQFFFATLKHSSTIEDFVTPLLKSVIEPRNTFWMNYSEDLFHEIDRLGLTEQLWKEIVEVAISPNSVGGVNALRCIQRSQSNVFIKPLGDYICRPTGDKGGENRVKFACGVLASFKTKEAADELISCLDRVESKWAREEISKQLDDLRKYYEQKSYWESFETAVPNTNTAANELLAMLKDEDPQIREAALLGLIPLGKAEVIPRVIPYLKDDDEKVRAAARRVLDALQEVRKDSREDEKE